MKLLDLKETAERLRMHYDTARDLIVEGKLRAIRLGGRWRVRESDLEAFLESSVFETPRPHSGPIDDRKGPIITVIHRTQNSQKAHKHEWRKRFAR